jgi:hypothetical protein
MSMAMASTNRPNILKCVLSLSLISCALSAQPLVNAHADEAPIASGQQTNGKARVDILSLKRTEGGTVTLRFAVTNENNADLSMTIGNMRLIDLVNRRTYSPGLESPSCRIPSTEKHICWAMFAAPNASVNMINVSFYEDFGLIPVPISN